MRKSAISGIYMRNCENRIVVWEEIKFLQELEGRLSAGLGWASSAIRENMDLLVSEEKLPELKLCRLSE
jgi:hypothetical protein